ncbi:hypothetical protein NDU88_004854 [Pleurodeles waltl]|uniref:Secreted protein n=1 Tax=Pleurodeles waltl TaxID=8319 RepID=A0AAV7L5U0_PLEWA|nr:hypothetical protein NDU88_004854 [Pleurodeles waltl]
MPRCRLGDRVQLAATTFVNRLLQSGRLWWGGNSFTQWPSCNTRPIKMALGDRLLFVVTRVELYSALFFTQARSRFICAVSRYQAGCQNVLFTVLTAAPQSKAFKAFLVFF